MACRTLTSGYCVSTNYNKGAEKEAMMVEWEGLKRQIRPKAWLIFTENGTNSAASAALSLNARVGTFVETQRYMSRPQHPLLEGLNNYRTLLERLIINFGSMRRTDNGTGINKIAPN